MMGCPSDTAILLWRIGMGIRQPGQIGRARARVQFAEQTIVPRLRFQSRNATPWITDVAEHDRIGRARGLACRNDVAVANPASFLLGRDAGAIDALNAVRALFHDAAAAHGDIGIIQHLESGCLIVGVLKKVEAPNLVWTVVGAIARADAAVIS